MELAEWNYWIGITGLELPDWNYRIGITEQLQKRSPASNIKILYNPKSLQHNICAGHCELPVAKSGSFTVYLWNESKRVRDETQYVPIRP